MASPERLPDHVASDASSGAEYDQLHSASRLK
jgi:hypothetical protein